MTHLLPISLFFFFNDTATTEIYTLSLHDALPISRSRQNPHRRIGAPVGHCLQRRGGGSRHPGGQALGTIHRRAEDRKSTRLNSSHLVISYAVFCLKKKKK